MSYEIRFTDDEERRRIYGELPEDQIKILAAGLEKLASDPFKYSHRPPCPDYRPIGRMFTVKLRPEGRMHFVNFFLHIDEPTKKIAIRRVTITPPLERRTATIEPVGMDELRDVIEIPERPPR